MPDGKINFTYSHYDRYIAGSAVPTTTPLRLETIDILKMPNFLDRREMGIINVGGNGSIIVEGVTFEIGFKDALYMVKEIQMLFSKVIMLKIQLNFTSIQCQLTPIILPKSKFGGSQ